MTLSAILRLIRGTGKVPAERDSFYNVLRTDFDPEGHPEQSEGSALQSTAA